MTPKYEALLAEYRKLAKRADQRLVRINEYSKNNDFASLKNYAYRNAMKDIRHWSGEKASRFNTAPPEASTESAKYMKLQAKVADIKRFLDAPTSTLSGTKAVYVRRAKAYSENFGVDMSWQEIKQVTDSALFEKLEAKMDRYIVLKVLGVIQDNRDSAEKRLAGIKENGKTVHINVDDPVVAYETEKVLRYYGKDLQKLLNNSSDVSVIGRK